MSWAGYAWRGVGSIVRATILENLDGKRLLGRLRIHWEDCVKRDAGNIKPEILWRVAAEDRDGRREIC